MATDLTLAARLELDSRRWEQGTRRGMSATKRFTAGVKREFGELRGVFDGIAGKAAALGGGFAVGGEILRSARMDKSLIQIGLTAGVSADQVASLRGELFGLGKDTGRAVTDLESGFNVLVQSGLNWQESRATLAAISKGMATTGAQAEVLAGTLGVASTAFQFDLAAPEMALTLLDKMTVAGRLGNAELENLGSIFARVGVNAERGGFGFEQTLAFIEGLSLIERSPERLATLADSTLRLFTNARYLKEAQKATGIKFFDAEGSRRDPLVVLGEIKKSFDALNTDAQREAFLAKAFGGADLDTIKGLSTLLTGSNLANVQRFTSEIGGATGTIERDLPKAMANAVDQSGRLKTTLIEAADGFAKHLNAGFTGITKKLLDSKEDGGMELSGEALIGGAAATLVALYAGKKVVGGLAERLMGGAASLGTGVAMGAALDEAGAATPVFVVGAAPGLFSGVGGGAIPPIGRPAGGAPGAAAAGRRIGTASILTQLGLLAVGATAPLSMLVDPRNYDEGARGIKPIDPAAFGGSGRGFDWARNLFGGDNKPEVIVTVEINDLRTRLEGVRVNGNVRGTASLREPGLNRGRMMSSPGVF